MIEKTTYRAVKVADKRILKKLLPQAAELLKKTVTKESEKKKNKASCKQFDTFRRFRPFYQFITNVFLINTCICWQTSLVQMCFHSEETAIVCSYWSRIRLNRCCFSPAAKKGLLNLPYLLDQQIPKLLSGLQHDKKHIFYKNPPFFAHKLPFFQNEIQWPTLFLSTVSLHQITWYKWVEPTVVFPWIHNYSD